MKPKSYNTKRSAQQNFKKRYALKFSVLLLFLFFSIGIAHAQNSSAETSLQPILKYLLAALGVIFLVFIYVVQRAVRILRENGRDIVFTYPLFRTLANNGKAVSVLLLLTALMGIIWAIQFKP